MSVLQVVILALVQGLAELLPVSSSAHVVVTEKLLGLDPSSPPMTLLLVMLHTGTMVAVIAYFWSQWRRTYFESTPAFKRFALQVVIATVCTAVIGGGIIKIIERTALRDVPHAQIEDLFSHLEFIAPALAAAGVLIIIAGVFGNRSATRELTAANDVNVQRAGWIGAVQGLCLPFRGFSRSGATISAGLIAGVARKRAEEFSFALAVVLTPAVIVREALRVHKAQAAMTTEHAAQFMHLDTPGIVGMLMSFAAGLLALRWLSRWLEGDRWHLFGGYGLVASLFVLWVG